MKPVDELNLLLELIRKYNLPLSPIMEYAINQKKEELSETPSEEDTIVEFVELLSESKITGTTKAENVYDYNTDNVPSSIETPNESLLSDEGNKDACNVQGFEGQRENRQGKQWTETEEHIITQYFEEGYTTQEIALSIGRTELGVKARLGKLGLIDYVYGQEDSSNESQLHPQVQVDELPIEDNESDDEMEIEHVYLDEKGNVVRTETRGGEERVPGDLDYKSTKDVLQDIDKRWNDFVRKETETKFVDEAIKEESIQSKKKRRRIKEYSPIDNAHRNSSQTNQLFAIGEYSLIANRKKAVLRAMRFFQTPTPLKNITKAISRSAWGGYILEKDVEKILKELPEVECYGGKYLLRR